MAIKIDMIIIIVNKTGYDMTILSRVDRDDNSKNKCEIVSCLIMINASASFPAVPLCLKINYICISPYSCRYE